MTTLAAIEGWRCRRPVYVDERLRLQGQVAVRGYVSVYVDERAD